MAKRSSGGRGGLARVPIDDLQAELRRRHGSLRKLEAKRAKLATALETIERQIQSFGGMPGRRPAGGAGAAGGRRRPRNEMNLVEALAQVLKGKTMSVTQVAQAVQDAGYRTTSDNFRTIVNQTLIKSDRFKKVGRGQYTAK